MTDWKAGKVCRRCGKRVGENMDRSTWCVECQQERARDVAPPNHSPVTALQVIEGWGR